MNVLCLLPSLADSGSCLQYFSSMYSPVNAIESLIFSVSPFIDTYCTNRMYYLQLFCTYSDSAIFVHKSILISLGNSRAYAHGTRLILGVGHLIIEHEEGVCLPRDNSRTFGTGID